MSCSCLCRRLHKNSHCLLSRKLHCQEANREVQVKETNSSFDHVHRALLLLHPANTSWCQEADYSLLEKAHIPPCACSYSGEMQ